MHADIGRGDVLHELGLEDHPQATVCPVRAWPGCHAIAQVEADPEHDELFEVIDDISVRCREPRIELTGYKVSRAIDAGHLQPGVQDHRVGHQRDVVHAQCLGLERRIAGWRVAGWPAIRRHAGIAGYTRATTDTDYQQVREQVLHRQSPWLDQPGSPSYSATFLRPHTMIDAGA